MISQTSEYALRAAVFLASREGTGSSSSTEIAEAVRVPVGYLQKILRKLTQHGILNARRGSGGGFALAKVASAISVLDVLRASDTSISRIERCPLGIQGHTELCALHKMLDAEIARSEQRFASTSLADLLDGEGGVRPLCDTSGRLPVTIDMKSAERIVKNNKTDQ